MKKFCTNCGQELDDKASFCFNCGKKIKEDEKKEKESSNVGASNQSSTNTSSQPKSKMAAGILGILLGYFGVHNFYLGYTGKGVAQLLITVLSCFTLSFVSAIWGLIEGILILTGSINVDADGNPLGD